LFIFSLCKIKENYNNHHLTQGYYMSIRSATEIPRANSPSVDLDPELDTPPSSPKSPRSSRNKTVSAVASEKLRFLQNNPEKTRERSSSLYQPTKASQMKGNGKKDSSSTTTRTRACSKKKKLKVKPAQLKKPTSHSSSSSSASHQRTPSASSIASPSATTPNSIHSQDSTSTHNRSASLSSLPSDLPETQKNDSSSIPASSPTQKRAQSEMKIPNASTEDIQKISRLAQDMKIIKQYRNSFFALQGILEATCKNSKSLVEQATKELKELRMALKQKNEDNETLVADNERLMTMCEQLQNEQFPKTEKPHTTKQTSTLSPPRDASLEAKHNKLKHLYANKKRALESLQKENETLSQKNKQLESEVSQFDAERERYQETIVTLKAQLASSQEYQLQGPFHSMNSNEPSIGQQRSFEDQNENES
jgi:hypothetical protein